VFDSRFIEQFRELDRDKENDIQITIQINGEKLIERG
jgi:hypothetical protein